MTHKNQYTKSQQSHYSILASNRQELEQDCNGDYWESLLCNVKNEPEKWKGKSVFDFGCGQGDTMINLFRSAQFARVDGGDIARKNIEYAAKNIHSAVGSLRQTKLFVLRGIDIHPVWNDFYDLAISSMTLQHIPIYELRMNILMDMIRITKDGGRISIQMGYDKELKGGMFDYDTDAWDASPTDQVAVTHTDQLKRDFENLYLRDIKCKVSTSYDCHENWVYISGTK